MNHYKLIIGILFSTLTLGVLIVIAAPKSPQIRGAQVTQTSDNLSSDEPVFSFGTVSMRKGNVSHTYKIKNAKSTDIAITRIITSCMCTKATITVKGKTFGPFGMPGHGGNSPSMNVTLSPDEEALVDVTFDPAAHGSAGIGTIDRFILITTSDNAEYQLKFDVTVTP